MFVNITTAESGATKVVTFVVNNRMVSLTACTQSVAENHLTGTTLSVKINVKAGENCILTQAGGKSYSYTVKIISKIST